MSGVKKIIFISSKDCTNYFPLNSQERFTHILNKPIELPCNAQIGLRDILLILSNPISTLEPVVVDLYLEQITGNICGSNESTLLKRILFQPEKNSKIINCTINQLDYVKLKSSHLDRLDFFIKPVLPSTISFDNKSAALITLVVEL